MSVKSILFAALFAGVGLGLVPAAGAQAPAAAPDASAKATPAKVFKLLHESSTAAQDLDVEDQAEVWVPGLKPGSIELSMSLGFMNLSGTLLEHEQMVYRYTTDSTYWGDVSIEAQTAFNPVARLGYTVKPWLTVESFAGLSISEYESTVVNRYVQKNAPDSIAEPYNPEAIIDPEDRLEQVEADQLAWEHRSLITLHGGLDVLVYPLNFRDDGAGRWHPYLTGQVSAVSYDMNSNFTSGAAWTSDIAFGGGLRLLAERSVSLRLEATMHTSSVEFSPSDFFLETNEGTTRVPLVEHVRLESGGFAERQVESYSSQDLSYLVWSIGFQGTF